MNFISFAKAVESKFKSMSNNELFIVDCDTRELEQFYLDSFPEGSNPIYRERTEHDCSCCKSFIRKLGHVVSISVDGGVSTIWDITGVDHAYQVVADALAEKVRSKKVVGVFRTKERMIGQKVTFDKGEKWDHFFAEVPSKFNGNADEYNSEVVGTYGVLKRSVEEINDDAITTVLELISENNVYRGAEFKCTVEMLRSLKTEYKQAANGDYWLWLKSGERGSIKYRIRNSVIGSLLVDLSEGVSVDKAVSSFESKVAPQNYRRPKPLVTQKMIDEMVKSVRDEGYEDALSRRFATERDISVNDVLFADKSVVPAMIGGVLEGLVANKAVEVKSKPLSVSVDNFLSSVIPSANSVELLFERRLKNKSVVLIAPVHETKPLFTWNNNFSWSYRGGVTDSIKERVKNAGGQVNADVRVSLAWSNADDLDLGVRHKGSEVNYARRAGFGAQLDVDMNGMDRHDAVAPVENLFWSSLKDMPHGVFTFYVNQYNKRTSENQGWQIEVDVMGEVRRFTCPYNMRSEQEVSVFTLKRDHNGVHITGIDETLTEEDTKCCGEWKKVDMMMFSPNHWQEGGGVGNKHLFFMLKGFKIDEPPRGIYNEFLNHSLSKHRKAMEFLGSKIVVEGDEDKQLSGVGFSFTKGEYVTVKVDGRIYTVEF